MNKIKEAVMVWSVIWGITCIVVFTWVFYTAYLDENLSVLFLINTQDEANLEAALFMSSPIAIVGLILLLKLLTDRVIYDELVEESKT